MEIEHLLMEHHLKGGTGDRNLIQLRQARSGPDHRRLSQVQTRLEGSESGGEEEPIPEGEGGTTRRTILEA